MPTSILYNDTHVAGEFSCKTFTPPAGSIRNAAIAADAAIQAEKFEQQYNKILQRAVPSGDETASIHISYAPGEILRFQAMCRTAPASGKSYTVDLQLDGVSVLNAVITFNDASTPLAISTAVIDTDTYIEDQVLSVVINDVAGGTLGTDLLCQLIVIEDPEPA